MPLHEPAFLFSILLMIYSLIQYFTGHAVEGYTTIVIVLLSKSIAFHFSPSTSSRRKP